MALPRCEADTPGHNTAARGYIVHRATSRALARLPTHAPWPQGYAPILSDQESFWNRRLYYRIVDCWNRPICSAAGAWIDVVSREFDGPLDASMSGQQLK